MSYSVENAVENIFSFSHNLFHCYISFVRQNASLCGIGLSLNHTKPSFNDLCTRRSILKTFSEKEEMLVTSISSFSNNVFYMDKYHLLRNIKFVVCTNFQFGVFIYFFFVFFKRVKSKGNFDQLFEVRNF